MREPTLILTERQRQCLTGVLRRLTAKQIGRELGITHHAVEAHLKAARRKLGAADTLEAARIFTDMDTTVAPYYGASDVFISSNKASSSLSESPSSRSSLDDAILRDIILEGRRINVLTPWQTVGTIAAVTLGLVVILALLIAVAQGIDALTS